ncbi:hypothetical protein ACFW5V_32505 [Streptomyces sp. NPDC058762]|uniref:hypothetical protein n=1 Tax=Streptomyces sp. NPDC058762 TaxID=3346629 RepID=UPI0036AE0E03
MSDPGTSKTPCSSCPNALEPVELVGEVCGSKCPRYNLLIVALVALSLVLQVATFVCLVTGDEGQPSPGPTSTAPAEPTPSTPPTGGGDPTGGSQPTSDPTPSAAPTAPGEPTCTLFDPECGNGGTSSGTEGAAG